MDKITVLVVDDSAFMRKLICDFLSEEEEFEVIGTARNGFDAIKKIEQFDPSVVTMDVEMPIMNGIEALKEIMQRFPRPVIMLSSTTKEGAENTIHSLQLGAFDFITKPSGAISLDLYKVKDEIKKKVRAAKRANLGNNEQIKKTIKKLSTYSKMDVVREKRPIVQTVDTSKQKAFICIGTSTGGPRALQQVIPDFPSDLNAPIFIVQHMPAGFTKSLATRLDTLSNIHVKEAEDGEIVKNGVAYIAPGGFHLKVVKVGMTLAIKLDQSPLRNGHRPSVDVMFESVSELSDYKKIAVVMTGMGSDGAKGLTELKTAGNVKVIAESEETSVVFGMPKAAVRTNLVDTVENLENITKTVLKFLQR
ncbi:protein-glutamate methylesterase/protein-glutamine glutaminase [Metabacillus fastidiosus]|uniref:protein-glutamate methylesterase/protein-glutamine glutaminase n=1 Tax=Metabacillus fastidiosus TaxID=1458 RepID=UPI003D27437E